jgi:hypothetical protein
MDRHMPHTKTVLQKEPYGKNYIYSINKNIYNIRLRMDKKNSQTFLSNIKRYRETEDYLHLHPEDGSSVAVRNVGIPQQHHTASQPRRPRHKHS